MARRSRVLLRGAVLGASRACAQLTTAPYNRKFVMVAVARFLAMRGRSILDLWPRFLLFCTQFVSELRGCEVWHYGGSTLRAKPEAWALPGALRGAHLEASILASGKRH